MCTECRYSFSLLNFLAILVSQTTPTIYKNTSGHFIVGFICAAHKADGVLLPDTYAI